MHDFKHLAKSSKKQRQAPVNSRSTKPNKKNNYSKLGYSPKHNSKTPQPKIEKGLSYKINLGLNALVFINFIFLLIGFIKVAPNFNNQTINKIVFTQEQPHTVAPFLTLLSLDQRVWFKHFNSFEATKKLNLLTQVNQAHIKKIYPDQLQIFLKLSSPHAVFYNDKSYYTIDQDAKILNKLKYKKPHLPIILGLNLNQNPPIIGKTIHKLSLHRALDLLDLINTNKIKVDFKYIDISDPYNLILITQNGTKVKLGKSLFIKRLSAFSKVKEKLAQAKAKSIDLRYLPKILVN